MIVALIQTGYSSVIFNPREVSITNVTFQPRLLDLATRGRLLLIKYNYYYYY